ncbi:TPM domain-containing protein [Paenibacillus sp. FSL H8-0034]|uniref:TPM domain-containing protein n=1 Tax=Paenibacillus sp. FSL H8-0034 TaxID=2954671 RepID=UPI0030F5D7F2
MKRNRAILAVLLFIAVFLAVPIELMAAGKTAPTELKQLVYDDAGLLNQQEYDELNTMANQYGAQRETDIIIVTSSNTKNIDVKKMTQDFYDEHAPGYDKPHGNAVILTMDMKNREVYLAGFYKAEQYLDDVRLDKIRSRISPDLTSGNFKLAFQKYIQTAHKYMGFRPGVNPDNILFSSWFQVAVSIGLAGIIVGRMAYHSGGRSKVHRQTYEDEGSSGILEHRDDYLRTTTSKRKIETNKSGGSRGGGGGTTGGGHSHSGSRGSF